MSKSKAKGARHSIPMRVPDFTLPQLEVFSSVDALSASLKTLNSILSERPSYLLKEIEVEFDRSVRNERVQIQHANHRILVQLPVIENETEEDRDRRRSD